KSAAGTLPQSVGQYHEEHRVRNLKGEWIWLESTGKVVERDEKGKPLRLIGTNLDITKRKSAEDTLRQAEEPYQRLIQSSPDAISLRRLPDFTYLDVNDRWIAMFGFSRDEVIGRSTEQLGIAPNLESPAVQQELETRGGVRDREFTFKNRNGELRI